MSSSVGSAKRSARRVAEDGRTRALARVGLAGHGAVYVLVGILALALAFGGRRSTTDQSGAVQTLAGNDAGLVLLVVIGIGLGFYSLWALFQAVTGNGLPTGKDGTQDRLLTGVRGVVYASLTVLVATTVTDRQASNSSKKQQAWTSKLMDETGGRWLVGLIGLVVVVVGVVLLVDAVRRQWEDDLNRSSMDEKTSGLVTTLGVVGKSARGIVVGLTGALFVTAAIQYDPKEARGLDGALRTLRETPVGPWLLVLVALGLIAFGLYGFCEARWRRLS